MNDLKKNYLKKNIKILGLIIILLLIPPIFIGYHSMEESKHGEDFSGFLVLPFVPLILFTSILFIINFNELEKLRKDEGEKPKTKIFLAILLGISVSILLLII